MGLFNKKFLHIFDNFVPNKNISNGDKDLPCINDEIKTTTKRKNWQFQCQRKSGNLDFAILNSFILDISNLLHSLS